MSVAAARPETLFDWNCALSDHRGQDWVQFLYEEPPSDDISVMRATVFKARRVQAQSISLVVAASDYYALYFGSHEWISQLMEEMVAQGFGPREAQLRAFYTVALLRQGARDWSLGLAANLSRMTLDQDELQFPSSGLHLFAVGEVVHALADIYLPKTRSLANFLPINDEELRSAVDQVSAIFAAMREYFKGELHPMYNIYTGVQVDEIDELLKAARPQTLR